MFLFGRKSNTKQPTASTRLGPEMRFKGDLAVEGDLCIAGVLEGDASASGNVHVEPTGRIEGALKAQDVILSGHLTGHIRCTRLEVAETGQVYGKVASENLVIRPGGVFMGDSHAKDDAIEPRETAVETRRHDNELPVSTETNRPNNSDSRRDFSDDAIHAKDEALAHAVKRESQMDEHDADTAGARDGSREAEESHDSVRDVPNTSGIVAELEIQSQGDVSANAATIGEISTEDTDKYAAELTDTFDISPRYR